jgi:hypothetical protein
MSEACEATAERCVCVLSAEHDGPHVCDDTCRGSWTGIVHDGTFAIVLYPGGYASPLEALAAALGCDDDG